ncbi:lipoyl(octanoyl) transferase [Rhodotorula toruloides]|uniref:lipoyl(octanoyl) transferase n=1 Tax=Rhodotorula toruloides TaxID=5286 RepID=A0A511KJ63_RHOTO|nr:lipoyl(octanoyl) transferase [Rhodotorula toruloides]
MHTSTAFRSACQAAAAASRGASTRPPILWTYIPGQIPYDRGLLLQESLVYTRLSAKAALQAAESSERKPDRVDSLKRVADTDVLLLLQHTPVFTAGRREKDLEQLEQEGARLRALGADYVHAMRGGQTTYHGPGQLVGYSLMDIGAAQLSTRCYVDRLERFLEDFAHALSIPVHPFPHTGVFTSPTTKIGSIGIHIRRRISLHGFSFNVEQQTKAWFDQIIACGLEDVQSTNVEAELRKLGKLKEGEDKKVLDVVPLVVELFGKRYGREMRQLEAGDGFEETRRMIEDGVEGRLPPLEKVLVGV